jgi:adenosylcobinamide-GDP ribazoletransferase
MRSIANSFRAALQFMTAVPVGSGASFSHNTLASAALFFPVIGLCIAVGGVVLNWAISPYVSHEAAVVIVLAYLVLITGGLHEDALGDAADGFGGGWHKEQILTIMRDSRVGSFGAIAIALSLLMRFVFLSNIPQEKFSVYLIAAQVISRWTALPLGYFLPAARGRDDGQGSMVARQITGLALVTGSGLMIAIITVAMRTASVWVLFAGAVLTCASALYYRSRIGGITGDCLGATSQVTEVAIYLTGVVLH